MRSYTYIFLVVAIAAGAVTIFGMTGVAQVAKFVYFVFMLLVAASIVMEPVRPAERKTGAPLAIND